MRWGFLIGIGLIVNVQMARASADEETKRVVGSVISGLLGGPQQSPTEAYTAQEQVRLVSLLQSGEYVTSRQGEPIDLVVYGVPLTHRDHVYTAKPIPPSRASLPPGESR